MSECGTQVLARVPLPDGLTGWSNYQFVITLEPKVSAAGAGHSVTGGSQAGQRRPSQAFNLLWGTHRNEMLVKLLSKYHQPRYRLLDRVIAEIQNPVNGSAFGEFLSHYEDPRHLSGGQIHFQISSESQDFLQKTSWSMADGNRSKVARAAMEFVCR
jgi:hypothetical protein